MAGVEGPVSLTDCPRCGSLCVGASVLRCGHMVCRRCLDFLLEVEGKRASCPFCHVLMRQTPKQSRQMLLRQIGKDEMMTRLVEEKLRERGDLQCSHHPRIAASYICIDCDQPYCGRCTGVHKKAQSSRRHLLCLLRQASSVSSAEPHRPVLTNLTPEDDHNHGVENDNEVNEMQDALSAEVKQLSDTGRQLQESLLDVQSILEQLQHTRQDMERKKEKLNAYITRLPDLKVRNVDTSLVLLTRLRRLREECRAADEGAINRLQQSTCDVQNSLQEHTDLEEPPPPLPPPAPSPRTEGLLPGWALVRNLWNSSAQPPTTPSVIEQQAEHQTDNMQPPWDQQTSQMSSTRSHAVNSSSVTGEPHQSSVGQSGQISSSGAHVQRTASNKSTSDKTSPLSPLSAMSSIIQRDQELAITKLRGKATSDQQRRSEELLITTSQSILSEAEDDVFLTSSSVEDPLPVSVAMVREDRCQVSPKIPKSSPSKTLLAEQAVVALGSARQTDPSHRAASAANVERHGAGPLQSEVDEASGSVDLTDDELVSNNQMIIKEPTRPHIHSLESDEISSHPSMKGNGCRETPNDVVTGSFSDLAKVTCSGIVCFAFLIVQQTMFDFCSFMSKIISDYSFSSSYNHQRNHLDAPQEIIDQENINVVLSFILILFVVIVLVASVKPRPVFMEYEPEARRPVFMEHEPEARHPVFMEHEPEARRPVFMEYEPEASRPVFMEHEPEARCPAVMVYKPDPRRYEPKARRLRYKTRRGRNVVYYFRDN